MVRKSTLGAFILLLAGCTTTPQIKYIVRPCSEPTPDRPTYPTEAMVWSGLDDWVKRAAAEIDLREGHEGRLRAALENCTRP